MNTRQPITCGPAEDKVVFALTALAGDGRVCYASVPHLIESTGLSYRVLTWALDGLIRRGALRPLPILTRAVVTPDGHPIEDDFGDEIRTRPAMPRGYRLMWR